MELRNEFQVNTSVEEAWRVLTDVEQIAPCIPGFELGGFEDGEYRGTMNVKVGAISMRYESKVRFVERDEAAYRAVMETEGRESRGQGGVTGTVTSTLTSSDGGFTKATMVTNLTVTGRVAQFGRGVLADVSNRLVDQFVQCLEANVIGGDRLEDAASPRVREVERPAEAPKVRKVDYQPSEPVDLVSVAGAPMLKRLAPVLGVAFAVGVALLVRRRN